MGSFCSHNWPCESVAGFWGFVYGCNKWLCSVQEVQLAVISDPFLRCEVSHVHVFSLFTALCHGLISIGGTNMYFAMATGAKIMLKRVLRKSDHRGGAILGVIWVASFSVSALKYKQTQGHCSLIQTNIPPSGFLQDLLISYLSVCTSFFPVFPMMKSWIYFPSLVSSNSACLV